MGRPPVTIIVPFAGTSSELANVAARFDALDEDHTIVVHNGVDRRPDPGVDGVEMIWAGEVASSYHARNAGAARDGGEWLLFCDADTEPQAELRDAVGDVAAELQHHRERVGGHQHGVAVAVGRSCRSQRREGNDHARSLRSPAMAARTMVLSVVGARPNFIKTAPVIAELGRRGDAFSHVLVHTGQHYDEAMSRVFFEELGVGQPDHMLGVGSGSHAVQTARVMERLEPVLEEAEPDLVLVPGDVNSTLAASLTAVKLHIPVGHIEAGLRSFDHTMPEETNRIVADAVSDLLFTHSPEARGNLLAEGAPAEAIHEVGNTMIDTLAAMRARIDAADAPAAHGLEPGSYLVVTLHRPALVDTPRLADAIRRLDDVSAELPVVFPAHPRTTAMMSELGIDPNGTRMRMLEPLGYTEFLSLLAGAAGALTDSGGIQEETTFLGVPCFTLRDNTERPVTCAVGTNTLLGLAPERISEVPGLIAEGAGSDAELPDGWDGRAAERLVDVIAERAPRFAVDRRPVPAGGAQAASSSS